MPDNNRKLRVFLCHASQDKPIVRELYQRLLAEGWIDPWLDEEKLLPGQDWDMEIEKAVEDADAVIVCISNNSVTKEGVVQKEIRRALDKAEEKPEDVIFIVPLRLENCQVPRRLKSYQYQDLFPVRRINTAYKKLFKSLEFRANNIGINVLEVKRQLRKIAETEKVRKAAEKKAFRRLEKEYEKQAYERMLLERETLGCAKSSPEVSFKPENYKILLIDDDRDWLNLLFQIIKVIGYDVVSTKSIEEMKTKLTNAEKINEPYSMVVTEMVFDIGGYEIKLGEDVARFVLDNFPKVKCGVISGHTYNSEETLDFRDALGISFILSKEDIDIDKLNLRLKIALTRKMRQLV